MNGASQRKRFVGCFAELQQPARDLDVKTAFNGVMANPAEFNKKLHEFWFGAGKAEIGIFNSVKAALGRLRSGGHQVQLW